MSYIYTSRHETTVRRFNNPQMPHPLPPFFLPPQVAKTSRQFHVDYCIRTNKIQHECQPQKFTAISDRTIESLTEYHGESHMDNGSCAHTLEHKVSFLLLFVAMDTKGRPAAQ